MTREAAEPVSVIIPARNEAATIARVIERVMALSPVADVVVADNGSRDDTRAVAEAAGARVVDEPRPGMGHAVRTAMLAARHDWVMKVDADLDRFDVAGFVAMTDARAPGVGLVKGDWSDPDDDMPMTRLLVTPAVALIAPGLRHLHAPNTGIYVADRRCLDISELTGSYAVDIDVMLRVHFFGAEVREVGIGTLLNNRRTVGHYNSMAEEIMGFFFERAAQNPGQELVVFDPGNQRPSAVSALMAARSRAGGRVTLNPEPGFALSPASTSLRIILAGDALEREALEVAKAASVPLEIWRIWSPGDGAAPDRSLEISDRHGTARAFFTACG